MIDIEDHLGKIIFGIFLLIFIVGFIFCIIDQNKDALAAEIAQNYCSSKGYASYQSYSRQFLGDKPFGIKCTEPLKPYDINLLGLI